jgi:hypothetical protein
MVNRNRPALRPEDVLNAFGPRFGEYPVSLLTRRALAQQTDAVITRRAGAPDRIWLDLHPTVNSPADNRPS